MVPRRSRLAPILAVAAALLAVGCGRSPVIQYHTLRPVPPNETREAAIPLAVGVGPLELPRYLDRPEIFRRSGGTRVEYDRLHRWAGGLEPELLRVLGQNLTTLLGTERVVVYPADAPFPLTHRVSVDVKQLDAVPGGEVVLRARWIVRAGRGQTPLAVEHSVFERDDAPHETGELAEAYSEVVGDLSRAIAARIRELAVAGEPVPPHERAPVPRGRPGASRAP